MYGKLVNGCFQAAPKRIIVVKDGRKKSIANPQPEDLLLAGYKPLYVDKQPDYDPETQLLAATYTEDADGIYQHWTVAVLTDGADRD